MKGGVRARQPSLQAQRTRVNVRMRIRYLVPKALRNKTEHLPSVQAAPDPPPPIRVDQRGQWPLTCIFLFLPPSITPLGVTSPGQEGKPIRFPFSHPKHAVVYYKLYLLPDQHAIMIDSAWPAHKRRSGPWALPGAWHYSASAMQQTKVSGHEYIANTKRMACILVRHIHVYRMTGMACMSPEFRTLHNLACMGTHMHVRLSWTSCQTTTILKLEASRADQVHYNDPHHFNKLIT